MNPGRPRLAGQCQSRNQVLGFPQVSRSLGLGARGGPWYSHRQGPCAPTYLALGRRRRRRDAVRAVVAPGVCRRVSIEGSGPPRPRPPVWRYTWRWRAGYGSRVTPATPTPPRLPLAAELTVRVPAEQEEADQQQQQQRCGPQRPGAPSEQHGCGQGSSRRGTTPGCGLHRGPCGPGRERRGQPWAAGPDGHPVFSPAVGSPPHLLQRRGVPNLTLSEAGWGAGKGEVEGRPAPSEQEPAPPPTWVQVSPPLGRVRRGGETPPGEGGGEGCPAPLPGAPTLGKEMREPSGWPEGSGAATREGPVQNYLL